MGFGVLLDFQVHHLLDQFDQRFCIHIYSDPDDIFKSGESTRRELISTCQAIGILVLVVVPLCLPGKKQIEDEPGKGKSGVLFLPSHVILEDNARISGTSIMRRPVAGFSTA